MIYNLFYFFSQMLPNLYTKFAKNFLIHIYEEFLKMYVLLVCFSLIFKKYSFTI